MTKAEDRKLRELVREVRAKLASNRELLECYLKAKASVTSEGDGA